MSAVTRGRPPGSRSRSRPVPPPHTPNTIEWSPAPARQNSGSRGWAGLAIASTLVAAGLGYLGFAQWQTAARASHGLDSANTQLQKLGRERTSDATKLEEQPTLVASQTERIEQDSTQLSDQDRDRARPELGKLPNAIAELKKDAAKQPTAAKK